MIAKITRAYVRTYSDNGQTVAYVEWVDRKRQNEQSTDTRCAFCDWIDHLQREGEISDALANRATL